MKSAAFELLATFEREADAEIARGLLANRGIESYLQGVGISQWLPLGATWTEVKLLVEKKNAPAARQVLASAERPAAEAAEPWTCRACHVEVEGGFDVCWFCGRPRGGKGENEDLRWIEPTEIDDALVAEHSARESDDGRRTTVADDTAANERETEMDRLLRRAWVAAILGCVLVPPLVSVYSMYLLIYAVMSGEPTTRIGDRAFYRALAINLLAIPIWLMIYFRPGW